MCFIVPASMRYLCCFDMCVTFAVYIMYALSFIHPSMPPILNKTVSVFRAVKWNSSLLFSSLLFSSLLFSSLLFSSLLFSSLLFSSLLFSSLLFSSLLSKVSKYSSRALDFILIPNGNNDNQLGYGWLGFRPTGKVCSYLGQQAAKLPLFEKIEISCLKIISSKTANLCWCCEEDFRVYVAAVSAARAGSFYE